MSPPIDFTRLTRDPATVMSPPAISIATSPLMPVTLTSAPRLLTFRRVPAGAVTV